MRFAIPSAESYGKAIMRSLKEQLVFTPNGAVIPFKKEFVYDFNTTREIGGATVIERYTRAVSNVRHSRKIADNLLNLVGRYTYEYEIDANKFQTLVEESSGYFDHESKYARLRWHDVVVMLLIFTEFQKESEIREAALFHMQNLGREWPELRDHFKRLISERW